MSLEQALADNTAAMAALTAALASNAAMTTPPAVKPAATKPTPTKPTEPKPAAEKPAAPKVETPAVQDNSPAGIAALGYDAGLAKTVGDFVRNTSAGFGKEPAKAILASFNLANTLPVKDKPEAWPAIIEAFQQKTAELVGAA